MFCDIVILYVIIEFATFSELHDDKDVVGGIEYLVKFDDIFVVDELEDFDLSFDLDDKRITLDIMFLFFILRLFMILTATRTPVMSCLASYFKYWYISPLRIHLSRLCGPICSARYALLPSEYNNHCLTHLITSSRILFNGLITKFLIIY